MVLGAGPSGVQRPAGIIPFRFNWLLRFCSSRTQGVRSSVVSRAESLDLCDDLSEAPDRDKDFAHGVLLVQLGVLVDCDVSVGQGEGVMEGGSTLLCLPDSRWRLSGLGLLQSRVET